MLAAISKLTVTSQEILANNPVGIVLQEVIYHVIIVIHIRWHWLWLGTSSLARLLL